METSYAVSVWDLDEYPRSGLSLSGSGIGLPSAMAGNRLADGVVAALQGVLDIVPNDDFRKRWHRHQKDAVVIQFKSDLIPHQEPLPERDFGHHQAESTPFG